MQEHYNYFMSRPISPIITTFAFSALIALSTVTSSYAGTDARSKLAGSPFDLVNAVNALRSANGLAPYSISPILMYTAQAQADFLAATGSMSHTGPGGSGLTDRLLAASYPLAGELSAGGFGAENITGGRESMPAQAAVDQWSGDALHLNNLFDNSIYPGTKLLIKTGVAQPTDAHTETPTSDLTLINTPISTATIIEQALTSAKVVTPLPSSPPGNTNTYWKNITINS